jgi:hypothetical protein
MASGLRSIKCESSVSNAMVGEHDLPGMGSRRSGLPAPDDRCPLGCSPVCPSDGERVEWAT